MGKTIVLTDCKISLDEFMQIVKKEAVLVKKWWKKLKKAAG